MLYSIWYNLTSEYKRLTGTGGLLVLFLVAMFYLYLHGKKEGIEDKSSDGWVSMSSLLSPFAAIAFAVTDVLGSLSEDIKAQKKPPYIKLIQRILLVLIVVFLLVISGRRIFSRELCEKADNNMHISQSLIEAMDYCVSDCEQSGEEEAVFITNPGYSYYFTAYSARLIPAIEETKDEKALSNYSKTDLDAYLELKTTFPDMGKVSKAAAEDGCGYIVLKSESYWPKVPLTRLGYIEAFNNGEWIVYSPEGGNK